MSQVAKLHPRGYLVIGPTAKCHIDTLDHLEAGQKAVLEQENKVRGTNTQPVGLEDLYPTTEVFDKNWCGPVDFSSEGVNALETLSWDEVYAKQILAKAGAENLDKYKRVAHLIGAIYFAGDFVAETHNESQLEELLKELGVRYNSWEEVTEGGKSWA